MKTSAVEGWEANSKPAVYMRKILLSGQPRPFLTRPGAVRRSRAGVSRGSYP